MSQRNHIDSLILTIVLLLLRAVAAFDRRTRSARELLRQVQADRFSKANPKLKINTTILGSVDPPSVRFTFADGQEVSQVIGDSRPPEQKNYAKTWT